MLESTTESASWGLIPEAGLELFPAAKSPLAGLRTFG